MKLGRPILSSMLAMIVGLLSWGLDAAFAITIDIDEFEHDTVLLPFAPQQGTLFLCENPSVVLSPVGCEGPVSDTILFLANLTAGTVLLESDLSEAGIPDAPGDRALPIPFLLPFYSIGEPGAEGTTQTLIYTPTAGQPGFALVEGVAVSYAITSDMVTEPALWLLLATGFVGLLGYTSWRRRCRAGAAR